MGATAVALGVDAPVWLVYALAALAATSITLTRPAQNGLLPTLSKTPETRTAANSVLATIENAGMLTAPALAGVLLALSGPGFVYGSMAAWLGVAVAGLIILEAANITDLVASAERRMALVALPQRVRGARVVRAPTPRA